MTITRPVRRETNARIQGRPLLLEGGLDWKALSLSPKEMDFAQARNDAAREIALLLGEPGAARGYPPSALATITKLVERAGNSAASGGAIDGLLAGAGVSGRTAPPERVVRIDYFGAVATLAGLRPLLAHGRGAAAVAIADLEDAVLASRIVSVPNSHRR